MTAPIEDGGDALGRGNLGGADGQAEKRRLRGTEKGRCFSREQGQDRSLRLHQAVLYFGKNWENPGQGCSPCARRGLKPLEVALGDRGSAGTRWAQRDFPA